MKLYKGLDALGNTVDSNGVSEIDEGRLRSSLAFAGVLVMKKHPLHVLCVNFRIGGYHIFWIV